MIENYYESYYTPEKTMDAIELDLIDYDKRRGKRFKNIPNS